ncbi:Crp/Fnr family transcriptional regulator [Desulfocurvibacter africanus]|uniref:Crp/Fnr family transcriptional regulator n=1 Tax=Desulfocurvibacter africanus TaxID=873 RepID=UPI002FDAFDDB
MNPILNPKRFPVLREVDERIVVALNEAAKIKKYTRNEVVFQKGELARAIYFLLAGKALFQADAGQGMTVYLGAVRPGYTFGWSAVIPGHKHHHGVVCSEDSEIVEIPAEELRKILESNPGGGYIFLRNMFQLANERLELRTDQLLKLFESNPQLQMQQP